MIDIMRPEGMLRGFLHFTNPMTLLLHINITHTNLLNYKYQLFNKNFKFLEF